MGTVLIVVIISAVFGLLAWALIAGRKQVVAEWKVLEELKKRANSVESKDEISELHRDMLTFANKTTNDFIKVELTSIDGFLRGLYKNAK